MNIGSKVKVVGSNKIGVITESNPRRIPNRNSVISFYTVQHDDGTKQEYGREELRYLQDESYKTK